MINKKKIVLSSIIFFSIFFVCCIYTSLSDDTTSRDGLHLSDKKLTEFYAEYPKNYKKYPDEIKAFYKAYTSLISEIKYINNDWLITLKGIDLYWADGKLLPPDKINNKDKYRSYGFYKYPDKLPEIKKEPDAEMLERIKRYTDSRQNLQRDNTFLETLYNGQNLKEIQKHIKVVNFLGFRVEAHESVIDRYNAIDKEIKELALKNSEIKQFLATLGSASTFIWRDIENSKSKSYHSFGIAIDINPKKLGKKQIYWNWTLNYNDKWYTIPYSERWMIPSEIVKIFEKYGFIWGGKWFAFDNMHFEYRPEILILSGREIAAP